MGTLVNSEDADENPHETVFNQGSLCVQPFGT